MFFRRKIFSTALKEGVKTPQEARVDQLKSNFLNIAQHQLRTPLSGVRWALEMLKADETISLQSQSLIDQSLQRVDDALGIVNEMLKTVERESESTLKIEQIDLAGMIRAIIAELNFIVVKKGVQLNFVGPDSLLIPGDRMRLKPSILNVIDNAVKYSPGGKVDITLTEDGEKAILVVTDTGIGIPSEDVSLIFERIHRSKNAISLEPDESGVGLSISKKIISYHKGTIQIESVLDKGTKVTITLPKN